jgi:hypothetical protein
VRVGGSSGSPFIGRMGGAEAVLRAVELGGGWAADHECLGGDGARWGGVSGDEVRRRGV